MAVNYIIAVRADTLSPTRMNANECFVRLKTNTIPPLIKNFKVESLDPHSYVYISVSVYGSLDLAPCHLEPVAGGWIVDSFLARLCKVLHNIIYTFQLSLATAVVVGQSYV